MTDKTNQLEFILTQDAPQSVCALCRQTFEIRAGYVARIRESREFVCETCAAVGQLPEDLDYLGDFLTDWITQVDFVGWGIYDGCFYAIEESGEEYPLPYEVVRILADADSDASDNE